MEILQQETSANNEHWSSKTADLTNDIRPFFILMIPVIFDSLSELSPNMKNLETQAKNDRHLKSKIMKNTKCSLFSCCSLFERTVLNVSFKSSNAARISWFIPHHKWWSMTYLGSGFLWDEVEYGARKARIWQAETKIPTNTSKTIRPTALFY